MKSPFEDYALIELNDNGSRQMDSFRPNAPLPNADDAGHDDLYGNQLSIDHLEQVDSICDLFESALRSGSAPVIEDYLIGVQAPLRPVLLAWLIRLEMELTRETRTDLETVWKQYRGRFQGNPQLIDRLQQEIESSSRNSTLDDLNGNSTPIRGDQSLQSQTPFDATSANVPSPAVDFVKGFELEECIGQGGFAQVWRARDLNLLREVAIKIPRDQQLSEESTNRTLREARLASGLRHPNIVRVYSVENNGGKFYIVSEFVHGKLLRDLIEEGGLSFDQSVRLAIQLADAIEHAHESGVIHRDLKPGNVILDEVGHPYVMDFGLARDVRQDISLTMEDQLVGTPAYMSPEQATGKSNQVDHRTDIWSLGVVMYEMVTGQRPYRGNIAGIIHQIMHDDPPRPSLLQTDVPRDLETIILKAMSRDRERRYPAARELRADLQRFLNNQPILARPPSAWHRLKKWRDRNPVTSLLISLIASLLVIISVGSSITALNFNELAGQLEKEKDQATRQLLLAWQSEARANLATNQPGHRLKTMRAVNNAVEILSRVQHDANDVLRLRNCYIDALTRTDLHNLRSVPASRRSAVSADLKYITQGTNSGEISVSRFDTGELLWSLPGIHSVSNHSWFSSEFSPSGKYVVIAIRQDSKRILESETGRLVVQLLPDNGYVQLAAFNSDETRVAIASRNRESDKPELVVIDLSVPDYPATTFPLPWPATQTVFHPDDQHILVYASSARNSSWLAVHDLETGELYKTDLPKGIARAIFTPDGNGILVAYADQSVVYSSWPELRFVPTEYHSQYSQVTRHVAFSNNGNLLITRSWGGARNRLWDVLARAPLLEFDGAEGSFDQTDSKVVSFINGSMALYEVVTSEVIRSRNDGYAVARAGNLHTSPCGKYLLTLEYSGISLRDSSTFQRLASVPVRGISIPLFLPDGRVIAQYDHGIATWTISKDDDGNPVFDPPVQLMPGKNVVSGMPGWIDVSRDGGKLAWRDSGNRILVANLDAVEKSIEIPLRPQVFEPRFAFSPDGKTLCTIDSTVRLVDANSGTLLHDFGKESLARGRVEPVFSLDGSRVVCPLGEQYIVIDVLLREVIARFPMSHLDTNASWSPDGSILALICDDRNIRLLDAIAFDELAVLPSPFGELITEIRFHNSQPILYASLDETRIVSWDLSAIRAELSKIGLSW